MVKLNDVTDESVKNIHLMVTNLCGRDCRYCCNKQYDLNSIPYASADELSRAENIFITGGEPFLFANPDNIAWYLKRKYQNIKKVFAYGNAADLFDYLTRGGTLDWLNGVTVSIKCYEDWVAFDDCINENYRVTALESNWLYCFPGFEFTECSEHFVKKNRVWQEEFAPDPNSIFRKA